MAEAVRQVATLAVLVSQHAVVWPIASFSAIMLRISNFSIRKDIRSGVRVALKIEADCIEVQAGFSLRCMHSSLCWLCHEIASSNRITEQTMKITYGLNYTMFVHVKKHRSKRVLL